VHAREQVFADVRVVPPGVFGGLIYALSMELDDDTATKIGRLKSASHAKDYAYPSRHTAGNKSIARAKVARGEELDPTMVALAWSEDLTPRSAWDRFTPRLSETCEALVTVAACETIAEFTGCGGSYGDAITGYTGRLGRMPGWVASWCRPTNIPLSCGFLS
jgi:hypothetical protein